MILKRMLKSHGQTSSLPSEVPTHLPHKGLVFYILSTFQISREDLQLESWLQARESGLWVYTF